MTYSIWITANCNMQCLYCYEGEKKSNTSMNLEKADATISFIIEKFESINDSELIINFHGGEPFLNFDIMEYIVTKMKNYFEGTNTKLEFHVTTNATIMTEYMYWFVLENIPDITISMDGTSATQNHMRPLKNGKDSYNAVISNAIRLVNALPNIRVRMTFDTRNVNCLYKDINHLVQLGFKTIVPVENVFDKKWDEKHLNILKMQIYKIRNKYKNDNGISISLVDYDVLKYRKKGKCSGGIKSINVYPDGKIYPCMVAGGIEEFCIGDIWSGIDEKKRDNILSYSAEKNPMCVGCDIYMSCDGVRCKIINKIATGDYLKPPLMRCAMENLMHEIFF